MPKFKCKDHVITMDRVLSQNLTAIRDDLRKDRDCLIIVDGYEGSGKSTLTLQMAKFIDHDLTIDNVVFTPEEFRERVMKAKKGTVIVYDEAITGSRSASWAKDINKALVEMMAQVRQKNLCIFMVIPTFFEMQKYYAIHRSKALVHVYTDRMGTRGFFQVYNRNQKTRLYVAGKKFYSYSDFFAKWNFHGRFPNYYPVDEKLYREKKLKAFMEGPKEVVKPDSMTVTKMKKRFALTLDHLKKKGFQTDDLLSIYDVNPLFKWSKDGIRKFITQNLYENGVLDGYERNNQREGLENPAQENKATEKGFEMPLTHQIRNGRGRRPA